MNNSDVVLAPYNYLLNPVIRENMGLEVSNSVVLFDEAHNLEDAAETCCSITLSMRALS